VADQTGGSRREFLQLGLRSTGALAVGGLLQACAAPSEAPRAAATPKPAPPTSAPVPKQAAPATVAAPTPAERPTMTVSQGATVAVSSPLWMAEAINAFADNGVDVTIVMIRADAATAALVNKQTDALVTSAGPTLVADLNGGLDEVYIAAYANGNTASLYAEPSIRNASDLKGKSIATDRPGTPGDYYTRVALSLLGLQPSDVQWRALGAVDVNLSALIAGQVNSAALTPPFKFQAEKAGFNNLVDTYDTPYLTNGVVVLKSRIDEMAGRLQGFVKAIQQGVDAFYDKPDLALQTISKKTGEEDPEVLKKTYDFFNTKVRFDRTLVPRAESLQGMLDFLAESTIPEAKNAKPEQFIDARFLAGLPT
jgi:ABC-type nitrate/sulfonate/bicarbonate transport system substrate-binding protein